MTCNNCIHYELCEVQAFNGFNKNWDPEKDWKHCGVFKDKSKYIELPCKVGDTVYCLDTLVDKDKCDKCPFYYEGGMGDYPACEKSITGSRSAECIEIKEEIVQSIHCDVRKTLEFTLLNPNNKILKSNVFLTKSEAEQKLKELKENRTT